MQGGRCLRYPHQWEGERCRPLEGARPGVSRGHPRGTRIFTICCCIENRLQERGVRGSCDLPGGGQVQAGVVRVGGMWVKVDLQDLLLRRNGVV